MPFTVSHAAAVLPMRRTRLVWSAMVIGSFGPDFQYFFFMSYNSRSWHYYPDVLRACLPFTLAAFLVFQAVIKKPVAGLLPVRLQRRIDLSQSYLPKSFREFLWILLSLIIGIWTHLVWDSFTHPFTWPWKHIAFLRRAMYIPGELHGYGYMAAQTFSTTLGLVILAIAFVFWWRRTTPVYPMYLSLSRRAKLAIWSEILVLTIVGAFWRANVIAGPVFPHAHLEYFRLIALISSIGWFCWELLAYGLLLTFALRRAQKERAHS